MSVILHIFNEVEMDIDFHHFSIHRDLKPENVLVSLEHFSGSNQSRPILKIADFGLSKLCASIDGIDNTVLESACGSDFFMSPEVYQGNYRV